MPLKLFCEKFAHTRFEPSGWTNNPDIGFAKSIMDYIFRWLQLRFLTGQQQMLFDNLQTADAGRRTSAVEAVGRSERLALLPTRGPKSEARRPAQSTPPTPSPALIDLGDAPTCSFCGIIMTRNGSCYRCGSCGSTSGCS